MLLPRGLYADILANQKKFTRPQLDTYAIESHEKAYQAQIKGYFENSLLPVKDKLDRAVLNYDESVNPEIDLVNLSQYLSLFSEIITKKGLTQLLAVNFPEIEKFYSLHHYGNCSKSADGASSLLIGNESYTKIQGLTPKAQILGYSIKALSPKYNSESSIIASKALLSRLNIEASDIDVYEIDENYAAFSLNYIQEMNIDSKKVNPNGGCISLGSSGGSNGITMTGKAIEELTRTNKRYGLICNSSETGMGMALMIKLYDGERAQ